MQFFFYIPLSEYCACSRLWSRGVYHTAVLQVHVRLIYVITSAHEINYTWLSHSSTSIKYHGNRHGWYAKNMQAIPVYCTLCLQICCIVAYIMHILVCCMFTPSGPVLEYTYVYIQVVHVCRWLHDTRTQTRDLRVHAAIEPGHAAFLRTIHTWLHTYIHTYIHARKLYSLA